MSRNARLRLVSVLLVGFGLWGLAAADPAVAQEPRDRALGESRGLAFFIPAREPTVTALPDGHFWAVWTETLPTGELTAFGHPMAPDGDPLTADGHPVALSERAETLLPRDVVADVTGTALVLLEPPPGDPVGARVRAFDPTGRALGASYPVFPDGSVRQGALATQPGGDRLVAAGVEGTTLHATRFTAEGAIFRRSQVPSPNAETARSVEVTPALLANGDIVLGVVEELPDGATPASLFRIAPDGTVSGPVPLGPTRGVLELAPLTDGRLLALTLDAGELVVRLLSVTLEPDLVHRFAVDLAVDAGVDVAVDPRGLELALSWVDAGTGDAQGDRPALVRRFTLDGTAVSGLVELSDDLPRGTPVPAPSRDRDPRLAYTPRGVLGAVWWQPEEEFQGPALVYYRAVAAVCAPEELCFAPRDRFAARVEWRDPRSNDRGVGMPVPVTGDTGVFLVLRRRQPGADGEGPRRAADQRSLLGLLRLPDRRRLHPDRERSIAAADPHLLQRALRSSQPGRHDGFSAGSSMNPLGTLFDGRPYEVQNVP